MATLPTVELIFPQFLVVAVVAILALLGAWLVVWPGGWMVARLLKSKKQELEKGGASSKPHDLSSPERGFADGGAVIGRLERLLIYLFVLSGELGAVGFLVAAKSIFRFGELSNQKNRLEAEYITIGTMMSFTVGLLVAMLFRFLIPLVVQNAGSFSFS